MRLRTSSRGPQASQHVVHKPRTPLQQPCNPQLRLRSKPLPLRLSYLLSRLRLLGPMFPLRSLSRRLPKLAGYLGREVVVICRSGARSATAAAILRQAGFDLVRNLAGGMLEWNARSLPVEH